MVDATVSTPALVTGLFGRLPAAGHELVLFDINRITEVEPLLRHDPKAEIEDLLEAPDLPFALSLVTNENEVTQRLVVRHKAAGSDTLELQSLGLAWPGDVYSLSHVALPIAPGRLTSGADQRGPEIT